MSEAKHTPGPFRPWKGAGEGEYYEPERWCVVVDGPRPYLVATIENGAPGDTLKTEAANARLFAASPRMLGACRAMVAAMRNQEKRASEEFHWSVESFAPVWAAAVAAGESAIAEATGGG